MSYGSIRKDIEAEFGDFFDRLGFKEIEYDYFRENFGNEIWHLRDASGQNVRIVRDRSQLFIELMSVRDGYADSSFYLRALGYPEEKYCVGTIDDPPQPGISKVLVADIMIEWPRMVELACSGREIKSSVFSAR